MKRLIIMALGLIVAVSCAENKNNEPAAAIGDRAFFGVKGNVDSIKMTYDVSGDLMFQVRVPKFNDSGFFYVNDIKYKVTTEKDTTIRVLDTDDEDMGGEEYVYCMYDKKNRLTGVTFWEAAFCNIAYDEQDRVVSYSTYGMMGMESEYHFTITYGEENFPIQVDIKEIHPDYEVEPKVQYRTVKYEYTDVDEHGNWTERKRDDGTIEKRTITYYPAQPAQ